MESLPCGAAHGGFRMVGEVESYRVRAIDVLGNQQAGIGAVLEQLTPTGFLEVYATAIFRKLLPHPWGRILGQSDVGLCAQAFASCDFGSNILDRVGGKLVGDRWAIRFMGRVEGYL